MLISNKSMYDKIRDEKRERLEEEFKEITKRTKTSKEPEFLRIQKEELKVARKKDFLIENIIYAVGQAFLIPPILLLFLGMLVSSSLVTSIFLWYCVCFTLFLIWGNANKHAKMLHVIDETFETRTRILDDQHQQKIRRTRTRSRTRLLTQEKGDNPL